jgi:hypothetical protein
MDMQHVLSVTGVVTTPFRLDLQAALPTVGRYLNYNFGKEFWKMERSPPSSNIAWRGGGDKADAPIIITWIAAQTYPRPGL